MQNMLRAIGQPAAHAAGQRAVDHIQVRSQRCTAARTAPVSLLTVDAVLPDDLELLRHPVDEQRHHLARVARGWRSGYPLGGFDEGFVGSLVACTEASDHWEEIG